MLSSSPHHQHSILKRQRSQQQQQLSTTTTITTTTTPTPENKNTNSDNNDDDNESGEIVILSGNNKNNNDDCSSYDSFTAGGEEKKSNTKNTNYNPQPPEQPLIIKDGGGLSFDDFSTGDIDAKDDGSHDGDDDDNSSSLFGDSGSIKDDDDDDDDGDGDNNTTLKIGIKNPITTVKNESYNENHVNGTMPTKITNGSCSSSQHHLKKFTNGILKNSKTPQDDGHPHRSSLPTASSNINNNSIEKAKEGLSKWARRLFDPNRTRAIIEPPQVIPLNDVYLKEFGRREKEFDESVGRVLDIDRGMISDAEEEEEEEGSGSGVEGGNGSGDVTMKKVKVSEKEEADQQEVLDGCKVRISNIAYTTPLDAIEAECQKYGPTMEVNLIMDTKNPLLSIGRAYVTFTSPAIASKFISEMNETALDGRVLRVSHASPTNKQQKQQQYSSSSDSQHISSRHCGNKRKQRYWERDISSKCYRCGEIGHLESNCTNDEKPRPCHICASTEHSNSNSTTFTNKNSSNNPTMNGTVGLTAAAATTSCQLSIWCFNCAQPGHMSRSCPYPRGMIKKRVVCTICCQSGHHRWNCDPYWSRKAMDMPMPYLRCLVCGEEGHWCCREMVWRGSSSSGGGGGGNMRRGVWCYNCGLKGHHGSRCDRPNLDRCKQSDDVAKGELERAMEWNEANEFAMKELEKAFGSSLYEQRKTEISQQQSQQQRGRTVTRDNNNRVQHAAAVEAPRAKSQPPPGESYRRDYQSITNGFSYPATSSTSTSNNNNNNSNINVNTNTGVYSSMANSINNFLPPHNVPPPPPLLGMTMAATATQGYSQQQQQQQQPHLYSHQYANYHPYATTATTTNTNFSYLPQYQQHQQQHQSHQSYHHYLTYDNNNHHHQHHHHHQQQQQHQHIQASFEQQQHTPTQYYRY